MNYNILKAFSSVKKSFHIDTEQLDYLRKQKKKRFKLKQT